VCQDAIVHQFLAAFWSQPDDVLKALYALHPRSQWNP
jgi:hypothetical protein